MVSPLDPQLRFVLEILLFYIPEAFLFYYIITAAFGIRPRSIKLKLTLFLSILLIYTFLRNSLVFDTPPLGPNRSTFQIILGQFELAMNRLRFGGQFIIICVAIKKIIDFFAKK